MNCFAVHRKVNSGRRKSPPANDLTIPTILENGDASESASNVHSSDCVFDEATTCSSASKEAEISVRRMSFRLGSDAEDSNQSSCSQRTTPSYSTGNLTFDFENPLSRSSSTCSSSSPKFLSKPSGGMSHGSMYLEIPRDPFLQHCGPMTITNSHSSDKLTSTSANRASFTSGFMPKLHISRSCSTLTKGVFGGTSGGKNGCSSKKDKSSVKYRRRSSNTDVDESGSKNTDNSRKSSDSENGAVSEQSIFLRLLHRWHHQNDQEHVPAHALFLRYSPTPKSSSAKSARSRSETEVENSVRHRLRNMVRRNTEFHRPHGETSGTAGKDAKSPRKRERSGRSHRPSPEEASSWAESFDNLLASPYGTALFRAFLKMEFNEEALAFYLACEKYKRLDPSSKRRINSKAQKIFDEFVRVESPREVNMDAATRAVTVTNLASPNRHCFDLAQRRIRNILEKDVYPRFLKFHLYTQLLEPEKPS